MNIITFLLVLMIFWVFTIFLALPIGIRMPDKIKKGHANSAPSNPRIGLKLLITFLISVVLTIIYWYIVYAS
ncbi:MAG: DUF1467 family protein [Rickettsiaceae bacterium]|nr:DUF1467 family protein [Rickettsiaceae bacterium]